MYLKASQLIQPIPRIFDLTAPRPTRPDREVHVRGHMRTHMRMQTHDSLRTHVKAHVREHPRESTRKMEPPYEHIFDNTQIYIYIYITGTPGSAFFSQICVLLRSFESTFVKETALPKMAVQQLTNGQNMLKYVQKQNPTCWAHAWPKIAPESFALTLRTLCGCHLT